MGLVSCPLTDPLKQTRDRLALACEVFDGDGYPQALIRLGQALADSDPLPVVERLSLADDELGQGHPLGSRHKRRNSRPGSVHALH